MSQESFPASIELKEIVSDLFKPVFICTPFTRGDTLFVVEQSGIVRIIINNNIAKNKFLDISDRVHQPKIPADERGLLGLAFHPRYEDNGKLYVNYIDKNGNTTISEFQRKSNNLLKIDENTEKILLEVEQPYKNHNGGHLEFDEDGYLYIGLGDGGSSGDPHGNAQNTTTLLGSILKINIDTDSGYTVPIDNPFINTNDAEEIWAYGLRDPWRFSIDHKTNLMYIADVGQNKWEELNVINLDNAGANFGWNVMEGSHQYKYESYNAVKNLTYPVYEYPNDANYFKTLFGLRQKQNVHGCSITGGYVYWGTELPELHGHYFFADYCTAKIISIKISNNGIKEYDWTNMIKKSVNNKKIYISSFGLDGGGEIYIVDHSGSIYKISRAEGL